MKKIVVFCLFAAALAMAQAQKQRVAVLPAMADPETKLTEKELDVLTDRVRNAATNILLPGGEFILLKQDFVKDQLGDANYFQACKEGTCIGSLMEKVQANFGARVEIFSMAKKLWLKFELYGTLIGDTEAGTIDIIPGEEVKDFEAMMALLDKKVPDAFKKILPPIPTASAPVVQAPVAGGNYVAQIVTEPAGATINLNGVPYAKCAKTPCTISLYENRVRLSAMLNDYETLDSNIIITQPNELIFVKLISRSRRISGDDGKWKLSIGDKSYPLNDIRLSPGTYEAKLSNDCYDDMVVSMDIKTGEQEIFNVSDKAVAKKSDLSLRATYKGRNQDGQVWVNGEAIGKTPFAGPVPLCSDIAWGEKRKKLDVALKQNEKVEHEYKLPTWNATLFGVTLDLLGAAALAMGVVYYLEAEDDASSYNNRNDAYPWTYDNDKKDNKDNIKKANIFFITGGALILSSIGVYLWF